jgi:hypothetical protein
MTTTTLTIDTDVTPELAAVLRRWQDASDEYARLCALGGQTDKQLNDALDRVP